ncbi:MAG: RAD55 family ATPase [Candidatus Hydrothermarchaeales archaeon]
MPFDIVKIATSITLAFLATSLYFTAKEYPTFAIYQNVSYAPLLIFLLVIIVAIMHILGYTRAIANRTHLKYWNYLRFGLSIHMVATFYVFGLIALEWSNFTIRTRALSTLFGLIALVFYILYASDMHVVISDLNIKFSFKKLDISRYLVSLYSLFFIIFFGISFTYNRTLGLLSEIRLESYPFILFFIAFFLLVFISYLSVTHKGFEEIMKKNVWSELSYLSSFAVFIVVYLMYISMTNVDRFPLHGMFFVAYFFVLIIETYAINTLGVRSKYEKEEEYAITDLLNFVAGHFLRSDYLVDIWEKNIDRYVDPKDMGKARFVAASRRFAINELDKETENTVATAMLFDLHHLSTENKVAVVTDDFYKTLKKDIEDILQEEILLLPEELRANFEEDKYYPLLFEKLVNDLMERIRTFVPSVEHKILFDKLSRISAVFADSAYDGEKIQIPHETRFSRAEFINHFKSYLNSLEELFPFEETLLYEPIKSGIKEEILNYGFSIEDLLDLVPTGVKKLDEITEGGLQRKTSTLILCGETRHKKEFLMSFVKQGIKDRDCVIFATSKDPSKVILNELRKEFLELEELTLIDLYQDIHTSKRVPNVIEKKNRIIIPTSTVFLRQSIVKTIKRYPKDSHKRVMLDVYNDLLRYFSYKELSTIIYQQLDGLRKWNCTTLLTLNPRQIPSENLEEMEKKFENILVISGKGREETILIKKLQGGAPKHKIISFH